MSKYYRIISLIVVVVFLFANLCGTMIYADKGGGGNGSSKQAGDTVRLRDGTGENCISNPDCDGTPDRDRLQQRDRVNRDTAVTEELDCDGTPDRDRLQQRDRINWNEAEIPEEVLTVLKDELALINQIRSKLANEIRNRNKNAIDELVNQLEKERLRFKEMLEQLIENEDLDENMKEWIRERFLNREFYRYQFRGDFLDLPEA